MFDDDGDRTFDVEETTDFVRHTLSEMGEGPDYAEADFFQCFPSFTEHGKGYMTKLEMMIFIKKVAGLDVGEEQTQLGAENAKNESQQEICKPAQQPSPSRVTSDNEDDERCNLIQYDSIFFNI